MALSRPCYTSASFIFYWIFIFSTTCANSNKVDNIIEDILIMKTPGVKPGTPEYLQALVNSDNETKTLQNTYNKCDNITPEENIPMSENSRASLSELGPNSFISVGQQDIADQCVKVPKCDEKAKYRSINGSCNNLIFPMWGMAGTALVRLVRATYNDGVNEPRRSVSGQPLPTPGELRPLFPDRNIPDRVNTLNVMEWGQVVSHDTSHIVNQNSDKGTGLMCCRRGKLPTIDSSLQPKACMPIKIPHDDQFYSQFDLTCINFVRSMTTSNLGCNLSPQQQVATVTHFVDASFVYGSFDDLATLLRTFSGGQLKAKVTHDNRHFPPRTEKARQQCDIKSPKEACYFAGDDRVNLNPTIAVHQIIFHREHNRLCKELQTLNPHWDDETLYQEARRIVAAITQHITYKEFLPIIIGESFLKKIKLLDGDEDQDLSTTEYDEFLNPSTVNGFTTAAYRSFHSLIPGTMKLISENFEEVEELKLDDFFFRPNIVQIAGNLDNFLRGLANQAAHALDTFFTSSITNLLFKSDRKFGTDLISIDIQRGRDHGLAPYNEFRVACGLTKAQDFKDLSDVMTTKSIQNLKSKYNSVDDIDFFVGGMMETLVEDTLVGPTFQCMIGEQFKRWRNGDRFYYEFGGFPGSLTKSQVVEIRKITLAAIFCRNGDNITKIQPNVFLRPSTENRILACDRIPMINLEAWRERT